MKFPPFPDPIKLAGGVPSHLSRGQNVFEFTLSQRLKILLGWKLVLRTTTVVKGKGIDRGHRMFLTTASSESLKDDMRRLPPVLGMSPPISLED